MVLRAGRVTREAAIHNRSLYGHRSPACVAMTTVALERLCSVVHWMRELEVADKCGWGTPVDTLFFDTVVTLCAHVSRRVISSAVPLRDTFVATDAQRKQAGMPGVRKAVVAFDREANSSSDRDEQRNR